MIFRVIVKFVEALLGVSSREERRADMYLPNFVLALGLVLCAGGTAMAIAFFFTQNTALLIFGILALVIGIVALLCWKNQSIKILSEHEFSYTTFLGNTKVYHFRDISGLRKNRDSITLFVGDEKIHIESCAILSNELVYLINNILKKLSRE